MEEEIKNLRSTSKPVPDAVKDMAALIDEASPTVTAFVQGFNSLVDHWVGYLVLLSEDSQESGENVSRSAAVRVDNVTEVVRVLEVLFKR